MESNDHERYEMRRCISLALACRPYASSFMIMEFVPKPQAIEPAKYMQIPTQLLYDKIDSAIAANENASDWELHELIVASGGKIVDLLVEGLSERQKNVSELGKEEFEMYTQEINFFIERLKNHPTLVKLAGKLLPDSAKKN